MARSVGKPTLPLSPAVLDEPLHTVAEVAETYRVDDRTVERWIADGSLRAERIGRVIRIPRSEVLAFRERHRTDGVR